MVPVVASILIGVGVKVGLGLAAAAAKKLMEPTAAAAGTASFPSLLKAGSPASAGSAVPGSVSPQPLPRVPYDLPGRLAAERLHGLALDVAAHRGVPGPGLTASRHADGPLAAYRRLDQAP